MNPNAPSDYDFADSLSPTEKPFDPTFFGETSKEEKVKPEIDYAGAAGAAGSTMNMINNAIQGSAPADKVARRFSSFKPQEFKRDTALAEANINETGNAQNLMSRGRAKTSGQLAGDLSRTSEGERKALMQVEGMETQRQTGIENRNQDGQMRTDIGNLGLANQYDDLNARNLAAKKKFQSATWAEGVNIAETYRKEGYQRSRDAKMDKRDRYIMDKGLLDTDNLKFNKDTGNFDIS
jgi:hypothetical protein